ncbi:MAG: hypothetical protein IKQ12_05985 [Prevotella sp.]|nr:hypothetical protein [Prevotella sp.]
MGKLRNWTLGIIGSSVLAALGFSACSGNGLRRENVECVYGPPPEFYNDTVKMQSIEAPDTSETIQVNEKK